MRKKLKARDWSLVYQHVRHRLQYEGQKQLRKPTSILINDTNKPWDEVWKEIRRNHALDQRPHRGWCKKARGLFHRRLIQAYAGPLPPLPPGIVIRTPSPDIITTIVCKKLPDSAQSRLWQLFQTTLINLQPLLSSDSLSQIETTDALHYPDSVYRLCIEGTPFTRMFEKILGL